MKLTTAKVEMMIEAKMKKLQDLRKKEAATCRGLEALYAKLGQLQKSKR